MRHWLQDGFESLINVFWSPSTFFASSDDSPWLPLTYNAFYAAVVHAVIGVFLTFYFDVLSIGWQGLLFTMPRVALRPAIVVVSVLLWAALVYAALRWYDYDDFATVLSVVGYSWLVSVPYSAANGVLYVVEEVLRAGLAQGQQLASSTTTGFLIASSVFSAASITHITVATVLGLQERLGVTWWQGVIAAFVFPVVLFLAVSGAIYAFA
jgi:hypothetical protein